MKRAFASLLICILCACGNSNSSTGPDPAPVSPALAVMDSGTYSVSIVLDMNSRYTTATTAAPCQSLQSSPASYSWVVTDGANGGTAYSIGGSKMITVTSGNNWAGESSNSNCTTGAGCPCQITVYENFVLSSTSFTGTDNIINFQAQACNGYGAVNYDCAYNITATESNSSDGGQRLIIVEHNAIDEMISQVSIR